MNELGEDWQIQLTKSTTIDFPMLSNIERGQRKARREWIPKLAQLLKANEDELLTAWFADRIQELVQDEKVTKDTIKTVASQMEIKVK